MLPAFMTSLVVVYLAIAMILVVSHFFVLKNWLAQQRKVEELINDGRPVPRRLRWLLGRQPWELKVHSACTNLLLFVFIISLPLVVKLSDTQNGSPPWIKLGLVGFIILLVTRAVPRVCVMIIRKTKRDE